MTNIAICLPSKNEADNISHVTKIVDAALTKINPIGLNLIINVDSSSQDDTVKNFLETKTTNQKISIVTNKYGKGYNIYKFLCYLKDKDIDCYGMFDTDLRSIEDSWLIKMSDKILKGADFVSPEYERSPFEGSTTNQFCRLIINGLFGKNIQQPIAGDFMFSRKLANKVQETLENNNLDAYFTYGIDIFLSLTAVLNNYNIFQVTLSKKIHNPSFPKIENMFKQVATSCFYTIKNNIPADIPEAYLDIKHDLLADTVYSHKNEAAQLYEKNTEELSQYIKIYEKIFDYKIFERLISKKEKIDECLWAQILADYIKNIKNFDVEILAESLKPLFILRAVDFWNLAENNSVKFMENVLIKQTKEFNSYLRR